MVAPEFVLKTTPPRLPRTALERAPLQRICDDGQERTAIAVVAPPGFGKTTLLAQWRRRRMEQGALVAWLRVDAQDDPARFTLGLLHALRAASARTTFDALTAQLSTDSAHDVETLTELLAEIAHLGKPTVLMIDDAERLPESTVRRSLRYLLHNAPPNLHIVIGSRAALPLDAWELMAKGELIVVGTDEMRLTLDESVAVLRKRLGARPTLDQCARLHEATCGWPLGLQLVAATIERETDLDTAIDALSARHGDIERFFFDALVARLPPRMTDFLVRTSILEHLNAESCEAITGCESAHALLAQLKAESPILSSAGLQDWVRVHPLARDFLLGRFEQLPRAQQRELHTRASHWFAEHERFHEAAVHALASGDAPLSHTYAARALWSLTLQGKVLEAREWLDRIPSALVEADDDLRVVVAWVMAIGERNAQALELAQAVLKQEQMPAQRRFVATRAAFTAASYGDRIGLVPAILDTWHASMPQGRIEDPMQALAYTTGKAMIALQTGDCRGARQWVARLPPNLDKATVPLLIVHREMVIAVSHLWDGDVHRAEAAVRPPLAAAERTEGRRSLVASAYATVLAAALLERDRPAEAEALLAHRLDVIDRIGLPDTILLAYRTLAYVAMAEGDERRALLVLDSLSALAASHRLPRLAMHALAERIRLHAIADRLQTVDGLLHELDAMAPTFDAPDLLPFQPRYALMCAIAHAYAAIARHDLRAASTHLKTADALAAQTRRQRDILVVMVLRAVVAHERGEADAARLLAEARGLARVGGCERLLADTHPLAVRMGAELEAPAASVSAPTRNAAATARENRRVRSGLLTTKEGEILVLLDKGMSNKSIARAMEISHETVKWHVKNLSLKLAAGTRKHAVDRARLLGLLAH